MQRLVLDALRYACRKHAGQTRFQGRVTLADHLVDVVEILSRHTYDLAILCAGAAHDVVEDTDGTYEEIERLFMAAEDGGAFGRRVAAYVRENTDPPGLPRAEQIRLQVETMPLKSVGGRLIKKRPIRRPI